MEETIVRVSVRGLVEFLLREGDLDDRTDASPESALLEGARMHREIQKKAGAGYRAEVALKQQYILDSLGDPVGLLLEGRADGIFEGPDPDAENDAEVYTWIDEIKTTYHSIENMDAPAAVHLAQAKCYAGMYALQNGLEMIGVRVSYCHLETGSMRFFHEICTAQDLGSFIQQLLRDYEKWVRFRIDWKDQRDASVKSLEFPYDYRVGQKELAANVYRTIVHGRKLFLEAPTGTGKTLTVLFPSVKALGEGKAERIFYLTAKTIAANAPRDAISLMQARGLKLKDISLTAKEKICVLEGRPKCDPVSCPRAAGHFDRINDALYDMLTGCDHFDRETIEEYAAKHSVCPFEFSLDLALYCDVIIGDYNYVFDPHAGLKRFFAAGGSGEDLFLIDEAHNLVERGRDMFSAAVSREDILALRRSVKGVFPTLEKQLNACSRAMLAIRKENGPECTGMDSIESFAARLGKLQTCIADLLESERKKRSRGVKKGRGKSREAAGKDYAAERDELRQEILSFYFGLSHFMLMYEGMDERYRIYSEEFREAGFIVKLYCMDPSARLREKMDMARASVLFSATFLPITYYKMLLGGRDEDYEIYAESVFDHRRQKILLLSDVTSRYRDRGYETYDRIARGIREVVSGRHGNYLVFFPSHKFLAEAADIFESVYMGSDMHCIRQKTQMSEQEREAFLAAFTDVPEAEETMIGFCVLGGIFSEGIDLTSDRLIGVIVVGTGIPQVCSEREMLKEYFDGTNGSGYDYAYRYPGMNKVMQAAGRVIRTAEDIGIVALFDGRFQTPGYRRLFPREWKEWELTTVNGVAGRVERFWNEWL